MKQTQEEWWAVIAEYYRLKSEGENPIAQYYAQEGGWLDELSTAPPFCSLHIWRIKPKLVKHKGGEYPAPCTDAEKVLEAGGAYIPDLSSSNACELFADTYYVMARNIDRAQKLVDSKLAYINKEDAIARAKVIYEID